jgi:hypothetical protein
MERTSSFAPWRRQWALTAALLLLALGGTAVATMRMPRVYQAEGSVVLLASRSVAKGAGSNPYLSFNGSLTLTADVLSREMMAPGTVTELASRGFADPYTVALGTYTTATTGSVLTVTVNGTDRARVEGDLGGVISEIRSRLARLQPRVKPVDRIRFATIAQSKWATLNVIQTARPLILVATVGLLLTVILPWIVDAQVSRQQARRFRLTPVPAAFANLAAGQESGWPGGDSHLDDTRVYPNIAIQPATRSASHGARGRPR